MTGQGSHLEFFFKDATYAWSKDDQPPSMTGQVSHLECFVKIQYVHGQKMTEPLPQYVRPGISPRIFFKDATCAWSKDD